MQPFFDCNPSYEGCLVQKTYLKKKLYVISSGKWVLNLMVYLKFSFELCSSCYQLSKKKISIFCIVFENLLFQETNDIVAMLLLEILHFII